jgi:hypothetical protein
VADGFEVCRLQADQFSVDLERLLMLAHKDGDQVVEVVTVRLLGLFGCCSKVASAAYQKCFLGCWSISLCSSSRFRLMLVDDAMWAVLMG